MSPFTTPELILKETGQSVPAQQAYLHLIRTAEILSAAVADLLATQGISGKQYNALRAVRRAGADGAPVSTIGEQMTDPRADVTRLLDRLDRDGLIERSHDHQDRRVVRVRLTDAGRQVLAALDEPIVDLHRSQFVHLSSGEIETLIGLLQKARGEV